MPDAQSPSTQPFSFPLSRRFVIVFSLAAAAFLLLLAWAITVFFRERSFLSLFTSDKSLAEQIILGLLLGVELAIYVALIVGKTRPFVRVRSFLGEIISRVRPRGFDMILVALVAGLSEEVFFRATLQPMLGIWFTSLLFVLAHVGVGKLSWAKVGFGAFVFSLSVLFGFTYEQVGLVAAIIAHASYDLVFLYMVGRFLRTDDAQQVIGTDGGIA